MSILTFSDVSREQCSDVNLFKKKKYKCLHLIGKSS